MDLSTTNPENRSGFVLLIAPALSYRVSSYIDAASKLNYQLLIVSNSKHSLVTQIASGITVDFSQPEQALEIILDSLKNKNVLTVLSTDDSVVTLASQVAQQLGLPHNQPQSSRFTYRKDLARIRLKEKNCHVPEFFVCELDKVEEKVDKIKFPVVLKPLMLSGSRGVIRANDKDEFISASQIIQNILSKQSCNEYEKSHFLVESFIAGTEVALDGFVRNGKLIPLALFDKPEPLNGPYFEESYYITPSILSQRLQQSVIDEVEKCCIAFGLLHGPIHAEAKITDDGIYLIEMASRTIGGQCAQMIEYVLDTRLEEIVIRLACEENLQLNGTQNYAGVLMIPIPKHGILKRVEGMTAAQQVDHIRNIEIHIQPGYELVPLPEGSSYLGFIFAQSDDYNNTYESLQNAHQQLNFITSEKWDLSAR